MTNLIQFSVVSRFILAITLTLGFSSAMAQAGYWPLCGGSTISSDSYGRGVESAFKNGTNLRPKIYDENCYQVGYQFGRSLSAHADMGCHRDFSSGQSQGVRYALNNQAGTACYAAGFNAGLADLNIAAREGDVGVAGSDCVRAYQQGHKDYRDNHSNDPSDQEGFKNQNCYSLGWYESPMVP